MRRTKWIKTSCQFLWQKPALIFLPVFSSSHVHIHSSYMLQTVQVDPLSVAFNCPVRSADVEHLWVSDIHPVSSSSHRPGDGSVLVVQETHSVFSTCIKNRDGSPFTSLPCGRLGLYSLKRFLPMNTCPSPSVTGRPWSSLTSTNVPVRGVPRGTEDADLKEKEMFYCSSFDNTALKGGLLTRWCAAAETVGFCNNRPNRTPPSPRRYCTWGFCCPGASSCSAETATGTILPREPKHAMRSQKTALSLSGQMVQSAPAGWAWPVKQTEEHLYWHKRLTSCSLVDRWMRKGHVPAWTLSCGCWRADGPGDWAFS